VTRPTDRDHHCTDLELLLPIREEGYRSLQACSEILGVRYDVLRRVVQGQACTAGEEAAIRQAWASYSPDAIRELAALVVGEVEAGRVPAPGYVKQLMTALERVLRVVERG